MIIRSAACWSSSSYLIEQLRNSNHHRYTRYINKQHNNHKKYNRRTQHRTNTTKLKFVCRYTLSLAASSGQKLSGHTYWSTSTWLIIITDGLYVVLKKGGSFGNLKMAEFYLNFPNKWWNSDKNPNNLSHPRPLHLWFFFSFTSPLITWALIISKFQKFGQNFK